MFVHGKQNFQFSISNSQSIFNDKIFKQSIKFKNFKIENWSLIEN